MSECTARAGESTICCDDIAQSTDVWFLWHEWQKDMLSEMTINERDDAMLPTYPAVLLGGVIEWGQGGAPDVPPTTPIPIHVTLLSPIGAARSGAAMAEALAILAATGGPSGFGDPTAWQQETRADRQLPGRTD